MRGGKITLITCLSVIVYLIGQEVEVKRLSIRGLLPETDYYMTYDGSTTMPACHETVTWIILNKPIYITKQQVGCMSVNLIQ
jgi:carbonic anhydrase